MSVRVQQDALDAAHHIGAEVISCAYDLVTVEAAFTTEEGYATAGFDFECCGEMLTVTITRQAQ